MADCLCREKLIEAALSVSLKVLCGSIEDRYIPLSLRKTDHFILLPSYLLWKHPAIRVTLNFLYASSEDFLDIFSQMRNIRKENTGRMPVIH